jgi:hypothetical protein
MHHCAWPLTRAVLRTGGGHDLQWALPVLSLHTQCIDTRAHPRLCPVQYTDMQHNNAANDSGLICKAEERSVGAFADGGVLGLQLVAR